MDVIQTYNSRYLSISGRHAKKCWIDRERCVETTYLLSRDQVSPSSRATKSSRSNVIALPHTITQMYPESEVCRLPQPTFSLPQP
jgi:hypothetical protein